MSTTIRIKPLTQRPAWKALGTHHKKIRCSIQLKSNITNMLSEDRPYTINSGSQESKDHDSSQP
jgi:hypothetical protein